MSAHSTLDDNILMKNYIAAKPVNIKLVSISVSYSNRNITVLLAVCDINFNNRTRNDNVSVIISENCLGNSHLGVVVAGVVTVFSSG